ncbi:cytochrome c maturation protein CcmE [Aliiglaciecola sp. 3_MG-2023]|uniref:cytochrome c maturation protein CcmE n=1 Tax=Aliiglaciecola sp. 3_MG-2023 TaxID=3062644 RepID=UPI0026E3C048|nr:cytochrome c maturation protein CcmE [Aliiglaciecola sp. 3_MG-2023]MDO6692708.1 cytochrome c maturation protein CcmE [Aliiglaciecola sp. 3_MG-2023]
MNPRRQKRLFGILAVVLLVAAAVWMMLSALSENIDHFYTPSEIINGKEGVTPSIGQRLRIGGMVVPGSVKRDQQSLAVSFDLADTGPLVTVRYAGILPDLFREGQGIVATGRLTENNLIVADEVLAKHDEEYMPPELAEKMKGIKHVKPDNLQSESKTDSGY